MVLYFTTRQGAKLTRSGSSATGGGLTHSLTHSL